MKLGRVQFAALLVGALLLGTPGAWAFSTAGAITQRRHHHKKKAPAKPVTAPEPDPQPAPPPPPKVPMDETAVPPTVLYENGKLTIVAKNSTLRSVLDAVGKTTGATFDISSGDTSERVVGVVGPGPARDVMATLLNGSHFNYVMVSPMGNPSALSRVLLTPKSSVPAAGYTAQQQPMTFQPPMPGGVAMQAQQQIQQNAGADEAADNADTNADDNSEAQDATDATPDAEQNGQPAAQGPQTPPGVKTPEQLLQELRQQQQQVIQQQQQGNVPQNPKDQN